MKLLKSIFSDKFKKLFVLSGDYKKLFSYEKFDFFRTRVSNFFQESIQNFFFEHEKNVWGVSIRNFFGKKLFSWVGQMSGPEFLFLREHKIFFLEIFVFT